MFEDETRKLIEELLKRNEAEFQRRVAEARKLTVINLPAIDRKKEKEKAG